MRILLSLLLLLGATVPAWGQPVQLTWNYLHPAPQTFVVRRSLDTGQTWQDVASLPGTSGEGLQWQDTTLAPSPTPLVVSYVVHAVTKGMASLPSNLASTVIGGTPESPVWSCTSTRPDDKTVILTCILPE